MINIRTGEELQEPSHSLTRRDALKGGMAAILATGVAPWLAGSANASVGGAARGMMRNVGARQAAVFGGNSPHEYIDYLTIGVGQWFDTLWKPTILPMSVEIEMRVPYFNGSYSVFCGVGTNDGAIAFLLRRNSSSNKYQLFNNSSGYSCPSTPLNVFFNMTTYSNGTFNFDSLYGRFNGSYNYSSEHSMLVGAWFVENSVQFSDSIFDLRKFICRDGDGVTVHDFRPVMRRSVGKYCFYDEICGTYATNGGAGEFTPPSV